MSNLSIGSASDEIRYRMEILKQILPELNKNRIVIYGTGINAKRVLDCMRSLNILGLMDYEHTGKYIYEKIVLSKEEIKLLDVDTILIAAEPQSTQIVYMRIFSFCIENHITILNMYGLNEFQLHSNILQKELEYPKLEDKIIRNSIYNNDAILISFKNVLCSEVISEKERLYEKIEKELERKKNAIPNFRRYRNLAEKRIFSGTNTNLKQIYNVLSTLMPVEEEQIKIARMIEEQLTLDNLIPRYKIIELIKYAIVQKKDVYIYSDMLNDQNIINSFLEKFGINQCKKILAERNELAGLLGRTIRALGEIYGYEKVLCIGNPVSDNLIIPQLYHVNFQIIRGSYDTFLKTTSLKIDSGMIENNSDRDELVKDILKTYDSPFLSQIDSIAFDHIIAEKIKWHEEEGKTGIEIFPIEHWNSIDEVEKLTFPIQENPLVSIIIPACNHFEYTYNCLKSILLNSDTIPYEVIVADDCSYDFTSKLEEIVSGITLIHNDKNLVFIKNCNNAAKSAKGKYFVFLNNDTQVQLNWLTPLVRCVETKENVGMVGAKLIYPDGSLQEAGSIIWSNAKAWNYGDGKNPESSEYNYVREVDYISGAAMMITKDLWEDIGGFDERYTPAYFEDADLAFEVRKRGKRVLYQPDSVVVHFEGISHGKDIEKGIKSYQKSNLNKFFGKWEKELLKGQYPEGENILAACQRKQKRKMVLFVSEHIPTYDKDAGSRTLDIYIQEFVRRGYIVKFIPDNFRSEEPYTHRLGQMGVEVLHGKYYENTIINWIYNNQENIDFTFLNYPNAASRYIDIFKRLGIPSMYYGMDLHYLRLQREYELFGDLHKAEEAKKFYQKEAYLIKNCDSVYYPSLDEVDIVKKEFGRSNVKQLMVNVYDVSTMDNNYKANERNGIMFIGGYKHTPNVDAVLWFSYHIFPKIYDKLKSSFFIAGSDMPSDISNIDAEGTVKLGTLTDTELEEMYRKIKMIVVPLRYGAGIKAKVIEAMYHGIPVVTTSIGIEGIPNENAAVRIADDVEGFAGAVIDLYQSEEKLMKMSVAGQEIIKQYYSREAAWNNIADDFI